MKVSFFTRRRQKGVTLIELMIAVAIFAILVALAVPSFQGLIERKNLEGAAEKLFADLQFAKSETIKRNQDIFITFDTAKQCYGLSISGACTMTSADCTTTTTCTIDGVTRVVKMSDFGNTSFAENFTGSSTSYDSRRGTAGPLGTVSFSSPKGYSASVVVSLLRIKIIK